MRARIAFTRGLLQKWRARYLKREYSYSATCSTSHKDAFSVKVVVQSKQFISATFLPQLSRVVYNPRFYYWLAVLWNMFWHLDQQDQVMSLSAKLST